MVAVIVALALTAAACGSDDGDADDGAAQTDTDEAASTDDGDSSDDGADESADDGEGDGDDGADEGAADGIQTDGFEDLGDVTLTVLAEAGDEATLERATEIFTEQYPNVTVDVTLRAFDDYMQIAPGILQSDDPPDVAHGNQGYTIDGLLVQGDLIIPLDDYAAEYGWEEAFGSGTLDQYRFDESGTDFGQGRLWGISAVAEFVGVYYNKEKLEAIGGTVPATFEEFEGLLADAKDAGEVPIQLGNAEGWPALHVYGMVQAAYRPAPEIRDWVFGEPGSTVLTDTEQQAADTFVEWRDAGYFPEGVNGIGWDDSVAAFSGGEGVFLIGGNWNTATLSETMGDNVGYFAMPVGPSGIVGGTAALALPWHITSKSEHPDLGAAFINLMMSEEFAPELAAVGRVPARDAAIEADGLLADVIAGAGEVIEDEGVTLYADWTTDTMFDTLTAKTQELLGDQITAEQFLTDIQADWDEFFAE